jgi:septal ring factor EnvC (AmiA/AmiB activator)
LDEIRASHGDLDRFLTEVFDQLGTLCAELVEEADSHVARLQSCPETTQTRGEDSTTHEALQEQLRQMTAHQALMEEERRELETELEAVRGRAAEMAESLAEHKRLLGQQQAEWAGEFRRIRSLLEGFPNRLAEVLPAVRAVERTVEREPVVRAPAPHAAKAGDPALDSVVAQFEVLQRDMARRRAGSL